MSETPQDFAKSFRTFMDRMSAAAPREEPEIIRTLREHFAGPAAHLPIVSHSFRPHDKPNLQIAVDAWCGAPGRRSKVLGVSGAQRGYQKLSLATMVTHSGHLAVTIGPVEYDSVDLADGRRLTCLHSGLLLAHDADTPLAVLVQGPSRAFDNSITVEVMAPDRDLAERFMNELRATLRERNVYRGRVISLGTGDHGDLKVEFHDLPRVERDAIILPPGAIERIERHTVGFSQHQEVLRRAGRHLKRGLLLYGPPGTGKTLTAMHLAARMPGRTVLLVVGRSQGLIEQTCAMARALEPATVILEDVDLIGIERGYAGSCTSPLLFELLNEMDGLASDCDVLFILTTNRPDVLEPALAARPGRVDQAIHVPLPDADCRGRLLNLYSRGLATSIVDADRLVRRTEGASAAFMKELMRRAALFAADAGPDAPVTDRELDEALHELVVDGGPLTRSLLGFAGNAEADGERGTN